LLLWILETCITLILLVWEQTMFPNQANLLPVLQSSFFVSVLICLQWILMSQARWPFLFFWISLNLHSQSSLLFGVSSLPIYPSVHARFVIFVLCYTGFPFPFSISSMKWNPYHSWGKGTKSFIRWCNKMEIICCGSLPGLVFISSGLQAYCCRGTITKHLEHFLVVLKFHFHRSWNTPLEGCWDQEFLYFLNSWRSGWRKHWNVRKNDYLFLEQELFTISISIPSLNALLSKVICSWQNVFTWCHPFFVQNILFSMLLPPKFILSKT